VGGQVKLTTKARYAVVALVDVARNAQQGPVSLADVAQRTEVSLAYLEQIFCKLRRRGLVLSVRGPGGGYRLARCPGDTRVADIIAAVDEPLLDCDGMETVDDPEQCCPTALLWAALGQQIGDFLRAVTLADVLERRMPAMPAAAAGLRAVAQR